MRVGFLMVLIGVALSGCGLAARQAAREEIQKTAQAERDECNRLYPDKHRRPVMPRVRCISSALLKEWVGYDRVRLPAYEVAQLDLVRLMSSRVIVAAERYDNGRLTEAEYDAEVAAAVADYNSHLFQRQQMADQTSAAQSAASSAAIAASNSSASVIAPMPRSPVCVMGRCY
jgi:hypothetical protein